MKKIIIPMLALVSGVALTSCEDQLDIQQKGATDIASYYTSDADCEAALAATYESFTLYTESRGNGDGPGIYTPAKVLANHAGDDVNTVVATMATTSLAVLLTSSVTSIHLRLLTSTTDSCISLFTRLIFS